MVVAANKTDGWTTEEARRKGCGRSWKGSITLPSRPSSHGGHFGKKDSNVLPEDRGGQRELPPARPDGPAEPDGAVVPYTVPIPVPAGRNRAFYMTQVGVAPPSFAVFVKDRRGIPDSFTRYLQNKIRDRFGFEVARPRRLSGR